tara:strand:+ start:403 stop:603 length:201 start_codon:yes stop_codon:yes gene_type:complete
MGAQMSRGGGDEVIGQTVRVTIQLPPLKKTKMDIRPYNPSISTGYIDISDQRVDMLNGTLLSYSLW